MFDLLNIGLYHGWLVDPQDSEQVTAVGKLSYNQLVEKIIATKQKGDDSEMVSEGESPTNYYIYYTFRYHLYFFK